MDEKKEEKKELDIAEVDEKDDHDSILDGKGLHDFYRHTTKLIK